MAVEPRGIDRASTIYDQSHTFQRTMEALTDLTLQDALNQPIPPKYTPEQMKPPRFGWVKADNLTIQDVLGQRFTDQNLNAVPPTDFNGVNGGYEATPRPRIASFW